MWQDPEKIVSTFHKMFHNALHDYLWDKQQAHECDILVFAFNATVVCALRQK